MEIFLEEADEILESAGNSLELWISQQDNLIELQSLQRDLHTLKGGARMAEVPELGDLGHELETLYEGLAQSQLAIEATLFDLLHRCHDQLAEMVEALKANRPLPSGKVLITAIHSYATDPASFTLPAMAATPAAQPASAPSASSVSSDNPIPVYSAADDVWESDSDPEILEIFLEESEELSDIIDACLTSWKDHPESTDFIDDLKRALHTLKGGARLAGLKQLGDISHDFETYLLELESRRQTPAQNDFQPMLDWHDQINRGMESVAKAAQNSAPEPEATDATTQANTLPAAAAKPVPQQPQKDDRRQRQNQAQPQEMVRVGADVLEALVNLAGETSINRGRVEQGITEFAFNVEEMGNTVQRLYEQLRRLDSETEAQIMSNYQKGVDLGEYDEDFDPLEMDQYSELHQVTKQLSESASDLLDLKNTLLDRNKDTETLLLQQARINTELQEKLMRTRMVPFSRLVPRLRRIVRQISGEVDKRVDFDVLNPEGELDRSLMERVVAPLEHMLRNAVDHGIETGTGREAAGKDSTGHINLELSREGGEVVITLSDDGKGIDTDAVRKKAIERGLVAPDAQLSEQEIQQFIFHAGFSTAAAVTQISGRGVGMDVVASEIKQMGGSVTIDSRQGQGTRFIIRLPFTLAMNRALMVKPRKIPTPFRSTRSKVSCGSARSSCSTTSRKKTCLHLRGAGLRIAVPGQLCPRQPGTALGEPDHAHASAAYSQHRTHRGHRGGRPGRLPGSRSESRRSAAGHGSRHQRRHHPRGWLRGNHSGYPFPDPRRPRADHRPSGREVVPTLPQEPEEDAQPSVTRRWSWLPMTRSPCARSPLACWIVMATKWSPPKTASTPSPSWKTFARM